MPEVDIEEEVATDIPTTQIKMLDERSRLAPSEARSFFEIDDVRVTDPCKFRLYADGWFAE